MATIDRPANIKANVSNTVNRTVSRQARRGVPALSGTAGGTLLPGSTDNAGEVIEANFMASEDDPTKVVRITYANPFQPAQAGEGSSSTKVGPIVVISPSNSTGSDAQLYVSARTRTYFEVQALESAEGLTDFTYHVTETGFINPPSTKLA